MRSSAQPRSHLHSFSRPEAMDFLKLLPIFFVVLPAFVGSYPVEQPMPAIPGYVPVYIQTGSHPPDLVALYNDAAHGKGVEAKPMEQKDKVGAEEKKPQSEQVKPQTVEESKPQEVENQPKPEEPPKPIVQAAPNMKPNTDKKETTRKITTYSVRELLQE